MKLFTLIIGLACIMIVSCNNIQRSSSLIDNAETLSPTVTINTPTGICNKTFGNKNNGQLFQFVQRLSFSCDSTFTYRYRSCISQDTMVGRWTMKNAIIYLHAPKLSQQKSRLSDTNQDIRAIENATVDKSTIVMKDSMIIWTKRGRSADTLYNY